MTTHKRLAIIRDNFERGVFLSIYQSSWQRLYRTIARSILVCKHGLRRMGSDYALLVDGFILRFGYPGPLLFLSSYQP